MQQTGDIEHVAVILTPLFITLLRCIHPQVRLCVTHLWASTQHLQRSVRGAASRPSPVVSYMARSRTSVPEAVVEILFVANQLLFPACDLRELCDTFGFEHVRYVVDTLSCAFGRMWTKWQNDTHNASCSAREVTYASLCLPVCVCNSIMDETRPGRALQRCCQNSMGDILCFITVRCRATSFF